MDKIGNRLINFSKEVVIYSCPHKGTEYGVVANDSAELVYCCQNALCTLEAIKSVILQAKSKKHLTDYLCTNFDNLKDESVDTSWKRYTK